MATMGNREIAFVGVRLVALYLAIPSLMNIQTVPTLFQHGAGWMSFLQTALILLPLLVGIGMFIFASTLARVVVAGHEQATDIDSGETTTSEPMFAAAGLVVMCFKGPALSYAVWSWFQLSNHGAVIDDGSTALRVWGELAAFAIGLWLFVGSPFWARLYRKVRS